MTIDASAELAKLTKARDEAVGRVAAVEAEARAAGEALAQAREALAESERRGGRPADRARLEATLVEAEARVREPWSIRADGQRRALRDADRAVADHVHAHLPALLEEVEQDGRTAAVRVDDALQALVDANLELQQVGQRIGQLLVKVSRPGPADVSRTRSDEVARSAASLLAAGGEQPPMVDRRRAPWNVLLGEGDVEELAHVDVDVDAVIA